MTRRTRRTPSNTPRSPHTWRLAAIVAACVGVTTITGCGRSESERALENSRRAMLALHTGVHSASPQLREQAYRETLDTLRPVVDRLNPSQSASAMQLMGQAEAGLAELHADRAGDLDRRVLNLVTQARSALETYASQIALSEALVRYSPDEETARLRLQEQALDEEMAGANAARRELQDKIDALESQIAAKRTLANAERDRERAVWASVVDANATDRAEAATRAHGIARVADGHEKEAALLAAQANLLRPQTALIETDIARIQRQHELLDAARRDLDARLGALRAESTSARTEALGAAERFERVVRDIRTLRDGDLAAAHNAAVNGFGSAIASYRRAVSATSRAEARAPVGLSLAAAQQAQANLHRSRAGLEDVVAQALARAETLTPPPPQHALIREMRVEAETRRDESLRAAIDTYQAARSTLQSVQGRADLGERLERVRTQVDEALARLTGVELPVEEDAAPVEEQPADEEWTEEVEEWTDDSAADPDAPSDDTGDTDDTDDTGDPDDEPQA